MAASWNGLENISGMSAVDGNRTESNIPKFDGKEENWFMWKAKFTGYMVANDLISVVEEGESSEIDAGDVIYKWDRCPCVEFFEF